MNLCGVEVWDVDVVAGVCYDVLGGSINVRLAGVM